LVLDGSFLISDNFLARQTDAIVLNVGYARGEIARNYYESNDGYFISVSASNPSSSVTIKDNYILNAAETARATVRNMTIDIQQNLSIDGVLLNIESSVGRSKINESSAIYPESVGHGSLVLDHNCVSLNSSLPPAALTSGAYQVVGGSVEYTPIGSSNVETITGPGSIYTSGFSVSLGDWMVFMCLVRKRTTGVICVNTFNNTVAASLGNTEPSFDIGPVGAGQWVFALFYVQASASSGGSMKWRFTASDGEIDVSNTYVYKITAPSAGTPIYYCLPNQ